MQNNNNKRENFPAVATNGEWWKRQTELQTENNLCKILITHIHILWPRLPGTWN